MPLALQHGALAKNDAALHAVTAFLEEDEHLGPDQADTGLGLNVPDYVTPGAAWEATVTGTDDPGGITCTVEGIDSTFERPAPLYATDDDTLATRINVPDAGLYRVTIHTDTSPALTQLVFAGPANPPTS